jgi:hypothetical protein
VKNGTPLSATLIRSGWLTRVFRVETTAGTYEVEYRGLSFYEWVLVDGVRAGRGGIWHMSVVAPHIDFRLGGPQRAEIDVRVWPWMKMRALRLVVGGKVLYSEGRIDDLLADPSLERLTEVKLLERRLSKVQAQESEWGDKLLLAERHGDPRLHERFSLELEARRAEVCAIEAELRLARLAGPVRQ